MATIPELEAAFVKADDAGDTESAQAFATEIKRLRAAPQVSQRDVRRTEPADQSAAADMVNSGLSAARTFVKAGPMGLAAVAAKPFMEGQDKIASYAGGTATDMLAGSSGRRSLINPTGMEIPPEVSGAVGAATSILAPTVIGGGLGGQSANAVRNTGKDMMISALRPTKLDRLSGDAERAAQTMIDEGANVTAGGVEKLYGKVHDLNAELQTALNSSPATIDKRVVASRLQDIISKIETSTWRPQDRVRAVEKIYNDVLGNHLHGNQVPVALANKIKSGIYKELGDLKYSRARTGAPMSDSEVADMALARGTKEEISAVVPSAEPLNSRMSKLINAADMSANSASAAAARSPGNMAWLTHDLPNFIAMVLAQHPASKSILARALYGNADTATTGLGAAVGGTAGALKERK